MAILDDVKIDLRISHEDLDSKILKQISAARAEMIRSGVPEDVANDDDNDCVAEAISTFCQMRNADSIADSDHYFKSWQYQLDCIRKSTFDGGD